MPNYQPLRSATPYRKRTVERLLALREKIQASVPPKDANSHLLLATWNIRDFDKPAYGKRLPEAMHYIAEIVAAFDLVAIQEVYEDLTAIKELMVLLGPGWDFIFTDVTEGSPGNQERMAFVYDTRKVRFGGLSGQLVLPPIQTRDPNTGKTVYLPVTQLARTPFMCGFTAGWTDFVLCTVHVLYGASAIDDPRRVEEIRQIAEFIARRAHRGLEWSRNFVLLGDFNIFNPRHQTMQVLLNAGFIVPPELQNLPTNVPKNKFYDQIAFMVRPDKFETSGKAGVFDFFETVFTDDDESIYAEAMGEAYLKTSNGEKRKNPSQYYRTYWRTHQMSDHLPMWVQIKIDHSDQFLKRLIT